MTQSTAEAAPGPADAGGGRPPSEGRAAGAEWAGLAVVLAGQAALLWNVRAFVTDDAWISLRYALRFARGDGPVWNAAGPTVEGYSNPLLVALEALVLRGGGDAVGFVRGLGVVCAVALVVATWAGARRLLGRSVGLLAAAIVGLSPAVAYWAVGGLETLPYALAYTLAALLLATDAPGREGGSRRLAVAGGCLAVLPWLRPEGLVLAGPLALASEGLGLLRSPRTAFRRLAWLLGPALVSALALELARLGVYGHLVPNSVIYKSGTGELGEVTKRFFGQAWPVLPFAVGGLVTLRGRARLVAVAPLVALAGSPLFRDSVNDFSRLLLPTWPGWAILGAAGIDAGARWVARRSAGRAATVERRVLAGGGLGVVAVLAVVTTGSVQATGTKARHYASCQQAARAGAGDWLRAHEAPGETYAVADAGLLPYRADGDAIDMFGLNEAWMQREGPLPSAERARRLLEAAPDWLVLTSDSPIEIFPRYTTEEHVMALPGFAAYAEATVAPGEACDYNLFVFHRTGAPVELPPPYL